MALPPNIEDHIRRYMRAFNARDYDAILALYAEGATLEDPVGSEVFHGKDAIRAFYQSFRDQASVLQFSGDIRRSESAVAFSFVAVLGDGPEPHVVRITDSFLFDEAGLIKEMRAFWGTADIDGVASGGKCAPIILPFAGSVALVSSAHTDLGRACALALAAQGARVVVSGLGSGVTATAEAIDRLGGQALIDSGESIGSASSAAIERYGRLDHIVAIGQSVGQTNAAVVEIVPAPSEPLLDSGGIARRNRIAVGEAVLKSGADHSLYEAIANVAVLLLSSPANVIKGQLISLV